MMSQRVKLYAAAVSIAWATYFLYALCPSQSPPVRVRYSDVKYILLWTPWYSPFNLIQDGMSSFQTNNCNFTNCYVTNNRNFLADLTYFDAVAFNGKDLTSKISLPYKRSEHQKYIFAATESSHYYPVCDSLYEDFFNWTWTYKLSSDIRWGYITIYDMEGRPVGPKERMTWPDFPPVSDELKQKLSNKSRGAAWFVSNCQTVGERERFYQELIRLIPAYNWTIDVYGECGYYKCPRSSEAECNNMLEMDYHFYFSFENSFSEDYVTEKLLTALNHYTIPVVYGAGDYSRYLPPGSYLNALELGPKKLLERMDQIFNNKEIFYDFFRWRSHFKYKNTVGKDDLCNLCAALNDEEKVHRHSVHRDLRKWWNDGRC